MTPDPLTGLVLHERVLLGERVRGDGTVSVYSGRDTSTDRPVTVTLLGPEAAADPTTVQAFLGRAQALSGLEVPGLPRVLSDGHDGDHVYMVTEHTPGESLAETLDGGEHGFRYGPHAALSIVADVLTTLHEAHDQGLVHGGLGPREVILDDEGRVTVTGFRMVDVGGVTPRTDVHAVGCLLYALMTGSPHFDHDAVPRPSSVIPGLPPDLDMLVANATETNPRYRPRDAGQYLTLVEQVLRSLPAEDAGEGRTTQSIPVVEADEPTDGTPLPVWRRVPVLVGAGVLVLALLATGWALMPDDAVELPDLTGFSVEMAEVELAALDLDLDYAYEDTYSDDTESGEVAATDPAAGTELVAGDNILLAVSIGPRFVEVPDVAGDTEPEARTLLRQAGFTEVKVVQEHSPDHDPGTVLSTTPEAGDDGDREEEITLQVSEGVIVPTLIDLEQEEAAGVLDDLGLDTTVVEVPSDTAPQGRVSGQDPEPGTILPEDGSVTLTISTGPEEIEEDEEETATEEESQDDRREQEDDGGRPEDPGDGEASEPSSGGGDDAPSCSGQAWDPRKVYREGDRVHYEGREYQARWWTHGLPPGVAGEWGAWFDQGPC